MRYFGYEDLDEFKEYAFMSSDFGYINAKGEDWSFHLDPSGEKGTQVYDYSTGKITGDYDTIEELIERHVFPDGAKFADVLNGDNYWEDHRFI